MQITYVRVLGLLNIGRRPRVEKFRGGLALLTSLHNNPILVNIFIGCVNKPTNKPTTVHESEETTKDPPPKEETTEKSTKTAEHFIKAHQRNKREIKRSPEETFSLKTEEEIIQFSHNDNEVAVKENNKYEISKEISKQISSEINTSACNSFRTCSECVKSVPCEWCHNLGCTNFGDKLCPHGIALKYSNRNKAKECPYIIPEPIIFASGIRTFINVKLYAPDPIIYDMNIMCQIKLKNRVSHFQGVIISNSVYCHPVMLNTNREILLGSFRLNWGGVEPYSNGVPVTVFNCEELAKNCESCITIAPVFRCGWCKSISSCVIANKCKDVTKWSRDNQMCTIDKQESNMFQFDFVTSV
ncbi:Plexin A [Operophtera brumata]|uniref:Plexin A n=1 Tax=Operophtera brumata TaxID=104452 RepID=A0A0L7LSA6_OPEBR|nr:Plexin A [Operophtera brumata]